MDTEIGDILSVLELAHACVRDLDGVIRYWSSGNERLYGWSKKEAVGRVTHTLLQTQFPEPLEQINAELLGVGAWSGELMHRTKSGEQVWVASHWSLRRLKSGPLPSVIEVNNDVTEARRSTERERYLSSIIASSDDAIISKNLAGLLTSWNGGAERMFGYSESEVVGRSVLILFPPELVPEEVTIMSKLLRGEAVEHHETVRMAKSGRRIPVSLSVSPILGRSGEVIGAAKIVRDISHRKSLERALQESEERQRLALEGGEVGVWTYDVTSGVSFWSPRTKAMFGLSAEADDLGLEGSLKRVHPQDLDTILAAFERCMREGVSYDLDFRIVQPSGYLQWVQSRGRARRDTNGKITQVHGTLSDITKRKQMEEALRRTNAQLEQFAYAAAHELQEPLRNVSLAIGLARTKLPEQLEGEAELLLNVATENSRRMEEMLRNLLAFSAAVPSDAESWPVNDTNEVVQLALDNLSTAIRESGAEVICDDLPLVRMDQVHLLQVMQNLVQNALQYRGTGPVYIQIGAQVAWPYCTLWVQDNGIGIKPDFRERVFGLFKRLGEKEVTGSGIGLALCRRIIRHYGGDIWIDPFQKDGTRFLFTVPSAERIEPVVKSSAG